METTRINKSNLSNMALLLMSILLIVVPFFSRNISTIIQVSLIVVWNIDILIKRSLKIPVITPVTGFVLWFVWCVFLRAIGRSSAEIGNYFILLSSVDIIIKSFYVKEYYSREDKLFLLRSLQIVLLLVIIFNDVQWLIDPNSFINFDFYPEKYLHTNKISSTLFYNMYAFFIGCSVFLFQIEQKTHWRIISVASIFFSSFFLVCVNPRMNAILLTVVFCITLFLSKDSKNGVKIVLVLLLFSFLAIIALQNKEKILSAISPRIRVRMESVLHLLSGIDYDIEGSSLSRRIELQLTSLRSFTNSIPNLLIGAGLHLGNSNYGIIGQHGFITDTIGAYGLVGISFLAFFFISFYRSFTQLFQSNIVRSFAKCLLLTFFVASFISNPFCREVCLVTFLMPVLIDSCYHDKEN